MKKVVITGATSMLGSALINQCIQQGTEVHALVRKNSKRMQSIPTSPLITLVECDLDEFATKEAWDCDFDAFYHYAWECTDNQSRNQVDAQKRNIGYTLDAVHLAHRLKCMRFIGAGSQAEYGRVAGSISPDIRVQPDNAYGVSKFSAGKLSSILCEQIGIEWIWTRIFSTYGVNDMPSTMVMYVIKALLNGEVPSLTRCEQQWDYLYCKDAAQAFYLLGKKGKNGNVYHVGGGIAKPLSEYVYQIRDAIDPSLPLGIGQREYASKQVMHLCADISTLIQDTGFSPSTSFPEGIAETIAWYRKEFL